MRLFRGRKREMMEIWLADYEGPHKPRWSAEPRFRHARELDPSEVGPPERVGFDGRPLPKGKGAITGLEGGGIRGPQHVPGA
jgi:hypothetical protein